MISKKACLKLWDILLCVVKTSKRVPFKNQSRSQGWSVRDSLLLRQAPLLPACHPLPSPCWLPPFAWPSSPFRHWDGIAQDSDGSEVVIALRQWGKGGGSGRWWAAVRVKQCSCCTCTASSEPWMSAVLCFTSPAVSVNLVVLLSEGCIRWSDMRGPLFVFSSDPALSWAHSALTDSSYARWDHLTLWWLCSFVMRQKK